MKIRINFVSNSSSTSYILCIPPKEDIEKLRPIVKDWIGRYNKGSDNPEWRFKKTVDESMKALKELQGGEWITEWEDDDRPFFGMFSDILDDYLIDTDEARADDGHIHNMCIGRKHSRLEQLLCGR